MKESIHFKTYPEHSLLKKQTKKLLSKRKYFTRALSDLCCCCSVAQVYLTLYDPVNCSTPGFPVLHPSPGVYSNSYPLSWWCHPTTSSSAIPFSFCLQSFSASGSFPVSWFFPSGGQSTGASASASVLPVNIQDWLSLGLSGLISLQSKGLSRVFSNTLVQKHQYFSAQSAFTSIHDYWKNHSFDLTDVCWQSNISAF